MEVKLASILGYLIQTKRKAQGISQQTLSSQIGLHPAALSKIERGIQQDVGVCMLSRIANGLSQDQLGVHIHAGEILLEAERIYEKIQYMSQRGEIPERYKSGGNSSDLVVVITWLASHRGQNEA